MNGEFPKLPKRQQEVWNIIEERREMLLTELVELAETTAATVRKLEDRGLVEITSEISERDPYAREHILPTQPLPLNPGPGHRAGENQGGDESEDAGMRHRSPARPEDSRR